MAVCIYPMANTMPNLDIVGSSSIQPVCEQLAEEYRKNHGGIDINVQGGGSSLGIKCADNGVADIGMSSKDVNSCNLRKYELGREGIAIVTNKNNSIKDLSTNQIKDIFSGKISDWCEVSNQSGKITVIVREEGSGTLDAFKSIIMKDSQIKKDAIVQNSAGSIKQAVMQDKNAISFVSLTHLDENLKNISIDGVEISKDSIKDGSYNLQRPFLLLTNESPSKDSLEFINWALSDESNEMLEREKIIKVDLNE